MMAFIGEWITNIVVFILFATILDMLIPSSDLGKYVQFVIGLLLLILLVSPLFEIFKLPVQQTLENEFFTALSSEDGQSRLETKKIEIQEKHHAYILEQMAVQLKKHVNAELKEKFQVQMVSGSFDATISQTNQLEEIHHLQVVIKDVDTKDVQDISFVQEIKIGESISNPTNIGDEQEEKLASIRTFFAQKLEIDEQKIKVVQEGEES